MKTETVPPRRHPDMKGERTMLKHTLPLFAATLLAAGIAWLPATGEARTRLTPLPDRAELVVSLENPNHTLLYEERDIPLLRGTNYVDFSWQGVSIDSRSVRLEPRSHPGDDPDSTRIIATAFPPDGQTLTWEIYSPEPRTERVRVSYLLEGITQEPTYEWRVNEEETAGDFRGYLLLRNMSGEDLDDAILRVPLMEDMVRSFRTGEARRFLAMRNREQPVDKLYVVRPSFTQFRGEDGETIDLVYKLANTQGAGLGEAILPAGRVRIQGEDGIGSTIFLGEDMLPATPPGEEAELRLGSVQDVTIKRRLMADEPFNVRRTRTSPSRVVLQDVRREVRYELENFKNEPVTVHVHEPVTFGEWNIERVSGEGVETERKSATELLVKVELPAAEEGEQPEKRIVDLHLVLKNRFPNE